MTTKPTIIYTGLRAPRLDRDLLSGVTLHHHPTIRISYFTPENFDAVQNALAREPYAVFLSRNGVIGLSEWAVSEQTTLDLEQAIVWAVGAATAQQVRTTFQRPAAQPMEQNALGLTRTFATLAKRPVVLFTAEEPRPEFPDWLEKNGWRFDRFPVYRTDILENADLRQRFSDSKDEYVVFTSPSTVKGFLSSLKREDLTGLDTHWISIGPSTSAEIESAGGKVHWESEEPEIQQVLLTLIRELT
ncbi:MAG: uroporphyrinogen-III synthase [Lentisphaeria bacterium]|nr:uroporphyrinogen-III synthase [Candidatus Neomarinimicrobiota bacterium]MCF7842760.1 uroporphyrinogen-III synthase [Lentisphaeria bacterium]